MKPSTALHIIKSAADIEKELKSIFERVKNDKITEEKFIEKMRKFIVFESQIVKRRMR